ncbi:MAG: hypothetical protein KDI88_09610 [Gammaproteobacteria bacterium]|nr:hypothetical protein [Gammaproteobacteria bacterium]
MTESATSARRAKAAERRREALKMRIEGKTLQQIGDALGITRQAAGKSIRAALIQLGEETREDSETLRALQQARIEHAIRMVWPDIENGRLTAIDRLVKLLDQQARLFGLYAPTRTALTDPSGTKEFSGGGMSALLKRIREAQQREDHEHDLSPKED